MAGVGEDEVQQLIVDATGVELGPLFNEAVHGMRDLPLEALFEPFGVTLTPQFGNGSGISGQGAEEAKRSGKPSLGVRVRGGAECALAAVHDGSAAQKAGLSAGDILIAVDGLRVTGSNLDALLSRYLPGATVDVHAFRRDELRVAHVKLDGPEVVRYRIAAAEEKRGAPARRARERWLHG
jgi:predicted metalloprotease with PDZ domain